MTIDDLKALVAKGATHVSFPVTYDNGKVAPMSEVERNLVNAGALWYQNRDDHKRTYAILTKSAAMQEGE